MRQRLVRSFLTLVLIVIGMSLSAGTAKAVRVECSDGTVVEASISAIEAGGVCDSHGGTASGSGGSLSPTDLSNNSGTCQDSFIFGFPTWYKYLPKESTTPCEPKLENPQQIILILLAVVEALTRAAAFIAFGYLIYGGIKYITSQGTPEGTKSAKDTILSAIVGLAIALTAVSLISFFGQRLG